MKARVFRNWRTTLLGVVLLAVSVIMLGLRAITGGEFVALLPTIVGLLCVPDSVLNKNQNNQP